jgi:arylsulfatase A-like enzyme
MTRVFGTLSVLAVCLTVFAWHGAAPSASAAGTRPDIIVVMVDDLGAIDGRILERLPNIRSLFLKNGLGFANAYSETPLCCPGRASFLTGQHTRHHGVVQNDARLLDPNHTIATTLDDAGYFTMMVGKYLNGAAQLADHTPPGWDEVAMLNDWSSYQSSDWWIQDQPATDGYFDRFIADQSAAWLASAPTDQPLFMWITPHAPHKSADSKEEWEPDIEPRYVNDQRCADIKPWDPPSYQFDQFPDGYPLDDICRSLLTVDDMVGQLRDVAAGLGRDPIWMFTSDNGMAWGEHGFVLKNVPTADRLPLFFAGPDIVAGRTQALVSNIDFAPTLADLAGTTMPTADGKSFASVLHGGDGGRKAVLEDHPVGGPTGEGDVATGPWWAVRTPVWHLVVWEGIHLYDTVDDPWEMVDVAAEHPDVVDKLINIWNRPIPSPSAEPSRPAGHTPKPTASDGAPATPGPEQESPNPSPSHKPGHNAHETPGASTSVSPTPDRSPKPSPGAIGGGASSSGTSSVLPAAMYAAVLALTALVAVFLGRRLRIRTTSPR